MSVTNVVFVNENGTFQRLNLMSAHDITGHFRNCVLLPPTHTHPEYCVHKGLGIQPGTTYKLIKCSNHETEETL